MRSSANDFRYAQLQYRLDALHNELAALKPAIEALKSSAAGPPAPPPAKTVNWAIFVPVIVALVGIIGTAAGSLLQARSNLTLEARKLESSIILQAITNTDTTKIVNNLDLFAELGLISLSKDKLAQYRAKPETAPGVAPASFQSGYDAALRKEILAGITYQDDPSDPRMVDLDDEWEAKNLTSVSIPELVGVNGFPKSGAIRFNVRCAKALQDAFAEIKKQNLLPLVLEWNGAFVPRKRMGGKQLSAHALGLAFDINAKWNGLRAAPEGTEGTLAPLVPIFEKYGFYWGGNSKPADPNHFECMHAAPAQP